MVALPDLRLGKLPSADDERMLFASADDDIDGEKRREIDACDREAPLDTNLYEPMTSRWTWCAVVRARRVKHQGRRESKVVPK